jgi:tol-pal system beta propeller repeat protein TolB
VSALVFAATLLLASAPCTQGAQCVGEMTCVQGQCRSGVERTMVARIATVAVARPVLLQPSPELERRAAALARHVEHALDWAGFYEVMPLNKHPRTPRREEMTVPVRALWRGFGVERVVRLVLRQSDGMGGVQVGAEVVDTHTGLVQRLGSQETWVPAGGGKRAAASWINGMVGHDTGLAGALGSRLLVSVEVMPGRKEIGVLDSDGSDLSFVTRNGSINVAPAWGPSGAVGYMSYLRRNPDWVVNGRPFSTRPGLNAAGSWSPDGTRLALSVAEAANSDIVLLDARTGEEVRRLTTHKGVDTSPVWSPDARQLAFVSDRTGSPQIWLCDLASGDLTKLSDGGYAASPVWSPRGGSIVYTQLSAGKGALVRHDLGTHRVKQLTEPGTDADSPTISPDGRFVVFVRRSAAQRASLWRVPICGGDIRPLAQQAWPLYAPDWQL